MCSRPSLHRNEKDLVELARQGSTAAFGEIYNRNVSLVYRYAYTLLGSRSDAEDVTAETFLRALQAIKRYRWTGRPVSSWLLTIARNQARNQLRRKHLAKDKSQLAPVSTLSDPTEARFTHGVATRELRQAIATLSPLERDVIILRFVLDLGYPRVAQVVGKSVDNVRVIQHRALRKLREKLARAESLDLLAALASGAS